MYLIIKYCIIVDFNDDQIPCMVRGVDVLHIFLCHVTTKGASQDDQDGGLRPASTPTNESSQSGLFFRLRTESNSIFSYIFL